MPAYRALLAVLLGAQLLAAYFRVQLALDIDSWRLPWTFVTYASVVRNDVVSLFGLVAYYFTARYFERLWSSRAFFRYWLSTTLAVSASLFLLMPIRRGYYLGLEGYLSGILVAYKQAIPEHHVSLMRGVPSFRVKHVPFAVLAAAPILRLLGILYSDLTLLYAGFLVSWLYLRFVNESQGTRGDRSETFAFVQFFPDAMQPSLRPTLEWVYAQVVKVGIVSPVTSDLESAPARTTAPRTIRQGVLIPRSSSPGLAAPARPLTPASPALSATPKPPPVADSGPDNTPTEAAATANDNAEKTGKSAQDSERRQALALRALEAKLEQKRLAKEQQPPAKEQQPSAKEQQPSAKEQQPPEPK
ncbi:hypothetical protein RI367_007243 [Sorochytrium milnesiophthora]